MLQMKLLRSGVVSVAAVALLVLVLVLQLHGAAATALRQRQGRMQLHLPFLPMTLTGSEGADGLSAVDAFPTVGIGQRLRQETAAISRMPGSQGKVMGIFPADPLVTVHDLPSVHEPTTYTPSANPRAPNLNRRMYQNALRTTTKQGCNIGKIAVSLRDDTRQQLSDEMSGALNSVKAVTGDLQLKLASHLAWFAGVQDVKYCSDADQSAAHFVDTIANERLPSWRSGCLFEDATVATLERPDNVPFQAIPGHFLSDIDSRHECVHSYAYQSCSGGVCV